MFGEDEELELWNEDDRARFHGEKILEGVKELRGCFEDSDIDTLELKKIWEM